MPPAIDIHFRKSGALFRSHPVTPPKSRIGEMVVPNPNRNAIPTLPAASTNVNEVERSRIRGAHMISPLVNPNVKAPKSTP